MGARAYPRGYEFQWTGIPKVAGKRPGIAFQDFVWSLERAISEREGVTVASSTRLVDKDTGRLREHDVVITWRGAHHTITTAIECKDTGRKVGVPEVEAFAAKCQKTGVNHAVIVSANGFAETARTKAAANNIDCMELAEASAFDWMGMETFVQYQRDFSHINAVVFFNAENPDTEFKLLDANDVEMTPKHLVHIVEQNLPAPENCDEDVDVVRPVNMHLNTIGWHGVDEHGTRFMVSHVELDTSYTTQRESKPVRLHSYIGQNANYAIASTDLKLGDNEGKLMFIKGDEDIRVVWSPDKPAS